jgi:hypothetical protein
MSTKHYRLLCRLSSRRQPRKRREKAVHHSNICFLFLGPDWSGLNSTFCKKTENIPFKPNVVAVLRLQSVASHAAPPDCSSPRIRPLNLTFSFPLHGIHWMLETQLRSWCSRRGKFESTTVCKFLGHLRALRAKHGRCRTNEKLKIELQPSGMAARLPTACAPNRGPVSEHGWHIKRDTYFSG